MSKKSILIQTDEELEIEKWTTDFFGESHTVVYVNRGESVSRQDVLEILFDGQNRIRRTPNQKYMLIDFDDNESYSTIRMSHSGFPPKFLPFVKNGVVVGFEAYGRWKTEGEIFSPNEFFPFVLKKGVKQSIDIRLITEAFRSYNQFLESFSEKILLSVNMENDSLDDKFIDRIDGLLSLFPNVERENIIFNVHFEMIDNEHVCTLRKNGFKTCIQYSGLIFDFLYEDLSFDYIKLKPEQAQYLSAEHLRLLSGNDVGVIGYFIENEKDENALDTISTMNQGYLYSKPLSEDEVLERVEV